MELRARAARKEGWGRRRRWRPVQLVRRRRSTAAAAAAGWPRTKAGGTTSRLGSARRARCPVEEAETEPRRAAARRKGLVIALLGVIAQLAIVANGPDVASVCQPFDVTVAVR